MKYLFVISGYNCERYVDTCLTSVRRQAVTAWRAAVVDDASADGTRQAIEYYAGQDERIIPICTKANMGAAYCRWLALQTVRPEPDEVILLLGLDDYLPHEMVLGRVGLEYERGAQVTYGSYQFEGGGSWEQAPYPDEVLQARSFRTHPWRCSPLQTFRASLASHVTPDMLQRDGQWIRYCTELAMLFPVLEAAEPGRVHHIPDVLYTYRRHNHSTLDRFGRAHKREMDRWIRSRASICI